MRIQHKREMYIPKNAIKFQDRESTAVVYASNDERGYYLIGFHGRAQKPDFNYRYEKSDNGKARREKRAQSHFRAWRNREAEKARRLADKRNFQHDYKIGDLFKTCWGYDQTNIEYFECVEVKGKHLILREIAQEREGTDWMQGKCVPVKGKYIGEPIRRLAQDGGVKISSCQWGSYEKPESVASVETYSASHWTAYA